MRRSENKYNNQDRKLQSTLSEEVLQKYVRSWRDISAFKLMLSRLGEERIMQQLSVDQLDEPHHSGFLIELGACGNSPFLIGC
jgi:hypothetical protein